MPYDLREPCKFCLNKEGVIKPSNGQDCVYCLSCGKWLYNAPKTETGRKARTIATTHEGITPKIRARILTRATGRCELCGKKESESVMHVGHLVSVKAGHAHGMNDDQINDDENLCALCEECNLGMGDEVVPLRLAVAMVIARCKRNKEKA